MLICKTQTGYAWESGRLPTRLAPRPIWTKSNYGHAVLLSHNCADDDAVLLLNSSGAFKALYFQLESLNVRFVVRSFQKQSNKSAKDLAFEKVDQNDDINPFFTTSQTIWKAAKSGGCQFVIFLRTGTLVVDPRPAEFS